MPFPDYRLSGQQVEPESSYWTSCLRTEDHPCDPCLVPRPIHIDDVLALTKDRLLADGTDNPFYVESRTEVEDEARVEEEFQELLDLVPIRDDPARLIETRLGRERLPVSMFLQLRPPPLGGGITVNTARGDAFPVIRNGRELARYFENNTPGVAHRQALNFLIEQTGWSPPRQGLLWSVLDATIYSALVAAWYFKWIYERTARRQRPHEYDADTDPRFELDVLYDRYPNSTGSDDGRERPAFPPVNQFINTSPGTPRHPAYPSGHSTYGGAASEILAFFFPDYRRELDFLADNTGVARLWAGIHWRSDHTNGMRIGRAVAYLMAQQLIKSGIPLVPAPRADTETPPEIADLQHQQEEFAKNCGKANSPVPGFIAGGPSTPVVPPGHKSAHVPGQTRAN